VEASKHGEVTSQASKAPMFLSSKLNDLMKMWRSTSKVDDLLIMCLRNAQKESPRYEQALNSSKYAPQGKECASPIQIITKNTHMDVINPAHVGQPSNHVKDTSKSEERRRFL
jgi:hypothetical protein